MRSELFASHHARSCWIYSGWSEAGIAALVAFGDYGSNAIAVMLFLFECTPENIEIGIGAAEAVGERYLDHVGVGVDDPRF